MKATSQEPPESSSQSAPANQSAATDSAAALLRGLIDYAGLFPPASCGMATAVANYEAYLRSEDAWMLGRFIVPVARLGEVEQAVGALPHAPGQTGPPWA